MYKVLAVFALLIASCLAVQIRPYDGAGKCMYYNAGNTWVQPTAQSCAGSSSSGYQWTENNISGFFTYADSVFGICIAQDQGTLVGQGCSGNGNALWTKESTGTAGYFRLKHVQLGQCVYYDTSIKKFYLQNCGINGSYQWFTTV